jgi:hypothetical protein
MNPLVFFKEKLPFSMAFCYACTSLLKLQFHKHNLRQIKPQKTQKVKFKMLETKSVLKFNVLKKTDIKCTDSNADNFWEKRYPPPPVFQPVYIKSYEITSIKRVLMLQHTSFPLQPFP